MMQELLRAAKHAEVTLEPPPPAPSFSEDSPSEQGLCVVTQTKVHLEVNPQEDYEVLGRGPNRRESGLSGLLSGWKEIHGLWCFQDPVI